jgi:hypothetical protein
MSTTGEPFWESLSEIEAEQRLIEGNRQLIERMEQKIAATLARIWREEAGGGAALSEIERKEVPLGTA